MNDLYKQALEALDELAEEKKIAFKLRAFTPLELADFLTTTSLNSGTVQFQRLWFSGSQGQSRSKRRCWTL